MSLQVLNLCNNCVKTTQHVIEKENKRHKQNYSHKTRCVQLGMGYLVLLKNSAFKGKHKIEDHWKDTIYLIEGHPYAGLPIFKISPVAGEGTVKVVHQNLFDPFGGNIEEGLENKGC